MITAQEDLRAVGIFSFPNMKRDRQQKYLNDLRSESRRHIDQKPANFADVAAKLAKGLKDG